MGAGSTVPCCPDLHLLATSQLRIKFIMQLQPVVETTLQRGLSCSGAGLRTGLCMCSLLPTATHSSISERESKEEM